MKDVKVVKKGTREFEEVKYQYIRLFCVDQPKETIIPGHIGMKSTKAINKLPMPFGCPDLEFYVWFEDEEKAAKEGHGKLKSFGFFCGRQGCICAPARSDMEEEYPEYCPPEPSPFGEDEDEYWEYYNEEEDEF